MKVLRLILFPFSFLFGIVAWTRNILFDLGILRSREFPLPVISVGNLTVGGAGKSPVTEYLIRLLKDRHRTATLSRGYGRKTRGFYRVSAGSTAAEAGDEPLQFRNKFPDITVAVAERRVAGLEQLQHDHDVIILDDAYQHRWVKPGFSILLFEYESLFRTQWFLPTGDLREPLQGRKRARCIVVTKCPVTLSEKEKAAAVRRIAPYSGQEVFFSFLEYDELVPILNTGNRGLAALTAETEILLLTGIANPRPLIAKLKDHTTRIHHHAYPDHYTFTPKNIAKIAADFNGLRGPDKLIITTEKDLQRLKMPGIYEQLTRLPVYYLPVKAAFHQAEKARFDHLIESYVT
ncbi:MAG TPA: tetraacyldisaccharide 4'-kinase, partial [Sphingobacteriaceae bacterium]